MGAIAGVGGARRHAPADGSCASSTTFATAVRQSLGGGRLQGMQELPSKGNRGLAGGGNCSGWRGALACAGQRTVAPPPPTLQPLDGCLPAEDAERPPAVKAKANAPGSAFGNKVEIAINTFPAIGQTRLHSGSAAMLQERSSRAPIAFGYKQGYGSKNLRHSALIPASPCLSQIWPLAW